MRLFSDAYEQDCEVLKNVPLFSDFYEAEIDALIRAAAPHTVPEGHVFLKMGAKNASIFVICDGSVGVKRANLGEDIPIATLGVGQCFGELSFMDGSPATATVTAAEATKVFEISSATLDDMIDGYAPLALKFWRNLALLLKDRLTKTNEVIDQYMDVKKVLQKDSLFREIYTKR
jgi:CRP-like cAMP-binding protein